MTDCALVKGCAIAIASCFKSKHD